MPTHHLTVSIRPLIEKDIASLEEILRAHVTDLHTGEVVESEVQSIVGYMGGAPDEEARIRNYLVACDDKGEAIGCMAISAPDSQMVRHFNTNPVESVELFNGFVSAKHFRGNGVGRKLFESACTYGKASGARYIVVNSGPRYTKSWGFYDRVCDSQHGFIEHKYGNGRHARTWRKELL